jgi:hypothetical protein
MVGTTCDPLATTDTTCAPVGLFCQGVNISDGGVIGSCVLPGDAMTCQTTVGCAPGMFCKSGVFGTGNACVQGCTQTSDCQDIRKNCVPALISTTQAGCFYNACGPGSNSDGGSINGTDLYSPCNAQDAGDGTCVPFAAGASAVGLCEQSGSTALNQPCALQRNDAGVGLCGVGAACIELNVSNSGNFMLFTGCLPLCTTAAPAAPDGGPGCDSTATCFAVFNMEPFGACFESCDLANPMCPSPLVCLNTGAATGICGPG